MSHFADNKYDFLFWLSRKIDYPLVVSRGSCHYENKGRLGIEFENRFNPNS